MAWPFTLTSVVLSQAGPARRIRQYLNRAVDLAATPTDKRPNSGSKRDRARLCHPTSAGTCAHIAVRQPDRVPDGPAYTWRRHRFNVVPERHLRRQKVSYATDSRTWPGYAAAAAIPSLAWRYRVPWQPR